MSDNAGSKNPIFIMEFPGCDCAKVRHWLLTHANRSQICWAYPENVLPDLRQGPGSAVWLPPGLVRGMGLPAIRTFDMVYGIFGCGLNPANMRQPKYAALLRDPAERMASALDEIAFHHSNTRLRRDTAACGNAREFLEQHPLKHFDNLLVRRLADAGRVDFGAISENHFQRALERARSDVEVIWVDNAAAVAERLARPLKVRNAAVFRPTSMGDQRSAPDRYGIDREGPYLRWDTKLIDTLVYEGLIDLPGQNKD